MQYCPLKFSTLANPRINDADMIRTFLDAFLECDKESCAWYCKYSNGEGECAICSLPSLFDKLDDIATQIATK